MPSHHLGMVVETRCFTPIKPFHARETFCVHIKEAQDSSALESLTITEINEDDVCFTFDVGSGDAAMYSSCLRTGEQQGHKLKFNKRCDFIIVRVSGGNSYVYFGDLKSKSLRKGKIFRQLYASKLFFDYIVSILKWEFPTFQKLDGYIPKYVCCHDSRASRPPRKTVKKATQVRRNHSPEPEDAINFVPVEVDDRTKSGFISFNQF